MAWDIEDWRKLEAMTEALGAQVRLTEYERIRFPSALSDVVENCRRVDEISNALHSACLAGDRILVAKVLSQLVLVIEQLREYHSPAEVKQISNRLAARLYDDLDNESPDSPS